jgi:hypothetical protein
MSLLVDNLPPVGLRRALALSFSATAVPACLTRPTGWWAPSPPLLQGRPRVCLPRRIPVGMVIVALAAALGGGSVRDLLLDRPVFWVIDQTYLIGALLSACATFFLARFVVLPARFFLVADAAGLALFTVIGTKAAFAWGTPWLVASFMGVITGVVGGVLRDAGYGSSKPPSACLLAT